MKGIFFSMDVLMAATVFVLILSASYVIQNMPRDEEFKSAYISRLASDVLVSLDKNETLDTLDASTVNGTLSRIIGGRFGYVLSVEAFQCAPSGCGSFNSVPSKSFTVYSDQVSEKNSVVARRSFLTFDGSNRLQYFNKAELKIWSR